METGEYIYTIFESPYKSARNELVIILTLTNPV